jgi:predicted acyl esterase
MTRPGVMSVAVAATLLAAAPMAAWPQVKGAGTDGRQWVSGPAPLKTAAERFTVNNSEIKITVRDGTVLGARLMLPQNVPGPVRPCVLLADGYGHNSTTGQGVEAPLRDLAARGYASVHASLRGSGNSGGTADLYNRFGEDGYDLVEWMAKQPWCNGKVGMVGASLLGISQWMTASRAPPSLKAIVPHVACGDCYDVLWYPGGMLPGPGRMARAGAESESAKAHRDFDDFWVKRTTLAPAVKAIGDRGVAVMVSGGWNDYISPANLRAYEQLPASAPRKLLFGPDAHGTMVQNLLPYSYFEYTAMWLDHYLRGIDNAVDKSPAATIFVQGANQWRLEPKWPIPDTRMATLYLNAAKSGSAGSLNDGSLRAVGPKGAGAAASVGYSPTSGPFLPTLTSSSTGRYKADQRSVESKVLTWTTPALTAATEVTGHAKVKLWAAVTGKDADFVVLLNDVAPDGTSKQVVAGYQNASHSKSRAHPAPPPQGEARLYEFELLPVSYVFPAGHRIRIAIAGGADVGADIAGAQGPGKSPFEAKIGIYQDARHASSLELPIVGTSWRQLTAK